MKLRTFLLIAVTAGAVMASTPGACSLPNPLSTDPMRTNDPCRGAVVTAIPGAIYMVGLNATPGNNFTDIRFIIQFGAGENGQVRAYYTWIDTREPHIVALINGRRYGSSAVELHMGLLTHRVSGQHRRAERRAEPDLPGQRPLYRLGDAVLT